MTIELCTESTKKLEMFKIESMNWNGTGVDPGPLGTIILVLEVVAVDLLAMNIDEIAAADGATAHILKDPVRHKEAKAASTRQIVAVPTGEVAIAIVLLQKDLKETRVGAVRKDTDDVGREAIAVAKDQSNQNSFLKRLDETVQPDSFYYQDAILRFVMINWLYMIIVVNNIIPMLVVGYNEQPIPPVLKKFRLDPVTIRLVRDKRRRAGRGTRNPPVVISEPSAKRCERRQSVDRLISGTLSFSLLELLPPTQNEP